MKTAIIAVILLTAYLIFYMTLFQTGASFELLSYLFLASPLVVIFCVYKVLTEKNFPYPSFNEGEEWGYLDKRH